MILPGCSLSLRCLAMQPTIPDRKKSIPSTSTPRSSSRGLSATRKTFPGPSANLPDCGLATARLVSRSTNGLWDRVPRIPMRKQDSSSAARLPARPTEKIPAWFFHLVSSSDLRISCASPLHWSRICSCYWRPVVLKDETCKTPERSTPYAGHWQQGGHQSCEGVRLAQSGDCEFHHSNDRTQQTTTNHLWRNA